MINLPTNFIDDLITSAGGIMGDLMPLVLLFLGVPLALWIFGAILEYASGSNERKIGRAIAGTLDHDQTLSAEDWAKVYRAKGAGYRNWVRSEKITEQDFLENYNNYKK